VLIKHILIDLKNKPHKFGQIDVSFNAAGGVEGVEKLVRDFYDLMDELPQAKTIRKMHPQDLSQSIDKLSRFLCGWLGGPRRYQEKYGSISIPGVHSHLHIGESEKQLWLLCMKKAIAKQNYSSEFSEYLLAQLSIPAERVREVSMNPGEQNG